jgi:hypothetical protein
MSDVANSTHKDAEYYLKIKNFFLKILVINSSLQLTFHQNQSLPFLEIESINFTVEITRGELVKMPFSKPGITTLF